MSLSVAHERSTPAATRSVRYAHYARTSTHQVSTRSMRYAHYVPTGAALSSRYNLRHRASQGSSPQVRCTPVPSGTELPQRSRGKHMLHQVTCANSWIHHCECSLCSQDAGSESWCCYQGCSQQRAGGSPHHTRAPQRTERHTWLHREQAPKLKSTLVTP